jgi:Glycosyl transferases group 1
VYFAPIEARDATRMRRIAEILNRPYVLHLWDFLDNADGDADTDWLIQNSQHVFCLNPEIQGRLREFRTSSSVLTFIRQSPLDFASFEMGVAAPTRRIAILGDIGSYIEGIRCLITAVDHLRTRGSAAWHIQYIGAQKMLSRAGLPRLPFLRSTGFLASPRDRDAALSSCHVGFLPGPTASPEHNPRSKYSIPSRILDFMSAGLPIVGTVHPRSATYSFCERLAITAGLTACTGEAIANALELVAERQEWEARSAQSKGAFSALRASYDLQSLKDMLVGQRADSQTPRRPLRQYDS